ncbi:ABC transporter permease [Vibrio sp. Of7-15]|uniref:ABC transporter permease n=1 Tax=Vibrio sp. Of7-15 TaxID=2724879 RepID=UPI001EF271A1|nr:ABC transporter permease [Vibrio sp. Of7-15]MCG7498069.1 ABC transporter permease [Vibrio sp. Of7-15]
MITLLQQTTQTLLAHRLRSLLAVIAIVWGIVSVLVLVALGEGFYRVNAQSFSLLMSDTQMAFPFQTSKPWQGLPSRRAITITEPEMRQLEHQKDIDNISVVYSKWDATVTDAQGHHLPGYVSGIDLKFMALRNLTLQPVSRNVTPSDLKHYQRVAIVGWQLAQMGNLFIGDQIKVNGIPFSIIGITTQSEGGFSMNNESNQVMLPSTTFRNLWDLKPDFLLVSPAEGISSIVLRNNLRAFFSNQQHFDPTDMSAVNLPDLSDGADFFNALFRGIQAFLGASGAMTLAVGALGVANIMFLSVTERTREIGVRLAVGATPTTILCQFILEGAMLVAFGTAVGIALSFLLVFGLNYIGMPEWLGTPVITFASIGWSLLITAFLALLAAYFPAQRAANLTPVMALSARA